MSAAQVAQATQSDEQQTTLKGTVVNSVTHAPISRALVYTPDNRFAMLTDGEGHFEFTLPSNGQNFTGEFFEGGQPRQQYVLRAGGSFSFMARKPGFLDDPDDRRQPETTSDGEITISLMPEGLIKGRIVSSEPDLPSGIVVQVLARRVEDGILKWTHAGTARANSSGEFRFAELLPGTYKVVTNESMDNDPAITIPGGQQYGFAPVYYPGVADFASAGTMQLAAGQTVQVDIPLTRQPYYPVRIPVANGELNSNMNITVSVQGHRGPGYSLGYNAQHQRIEGLLPQGNYLVEATTFGPTFSYGAVNLAVAGAPAEGSSLTLIPNSSITVHVTEQFTATESTGNMTWNVGGRFFDVHGPRAYLQIDAESADDFRQQGASLRPPAGPNDDSLVLENLAPGRYWLRLHSSRGYVAAATISGVDLLHEPLIVSPGSNTPVDVIMRDDNAELDGTVAGIASPTADSNTTQQGWVYCIPISDGPGQFQQVWVSSDGKFTSAQMTPGTYRMLAFASRQPNLPYRDPEAMKPYETKGQVVHLTAGQKTSVQLQLIPNVE